jgi:hypothetical protein
MAVAGIVLKAILRTWLSQQCPTGWIRPALTVSPTFKKIGSSSLDLDLADRTA